MHKWGEGVFACHVHVRLTIEISTHFTLPSLYKHVECLQRMQFLFSSVVARAANGEKCIEDPVKILNLYAYGPLPH